MTITLGERIPAAVLVTRDAAGQHDMVLPEALKGRTVVIFGVPAAFSGTCTSAHVPSFIRTKAKFMAKGVDEIICVSVNDSYVMQAWGGTTGANAAGITMAGDVDASFTTAIGMDYPAGFARGQARSDRYAMLVVDGVVKVLNKEDTNGACNIAAGEGLLEAM